LPAQEKGKEGESKSAMKKRLAKEKEREAVDVRGGGKGKATASSLSSAKTGKRTKLLDEERETGSAKKRRLAAAAEGGKEGQEGMDEMRWEADDDLVAFSGSSKSKREKEKKLSEGEQAALARKAEFARPGGFDGAKKAAGGKKGKGVLGDYAWGKQGEQREWDAGKDSSESSSDDDDEDSNSDDDLNLELDEEEAADEALFAAYDREAGLSEDGQVEEDVKKPKKGGKKGEKGRQTMREEERFVEGKKKVGAAGGGKAKKGGRR
jgi:hypothetical protein